jgi:MFS family permease
MMLADEGRLTSAHRRILFLAWAGWMFDFYDLILYSFLLGPISTDLGLTPLQHSWVMGFSLGMTALGGILCGALADRFGRRPVLQGTILAYSIGTLMCAFAGSLPALLFWRSVTGLGVGGEWGSGHALIAETFPAKRRGHYGALMQSGAPLGVGLAALMGSLFAPAFGWRATFLVSGLPALLVAAVRRGIPESDLWERQRQGRVRPVAVWEPIAALFRGGVRGTAVRALVLAVFNMSAYWFTYVWFPGYLQQDRGMSVVKSGQWVLVIVAGELAGYASFGAVSDRIGRKPAFTLYSFFMAGGLALITIFWNAIAGSTALLLTAMALLGIGTGTWSNFGPFFSELFPTAIRNAAIGSALNLARGVQFFTPLVITAVARAGYGLAGGISLASLFSLLAGLWIWTLPETRGRDLSSLDGAPGHRADSGP